MSMRIKEINKEFGAILKMRRGVLHLSQQEFADRVGLSRASIANIERGEQGISLGQLYEFSEALKLPIETLMPPSSAANLNEFGEQTSSWIRSVLRDAENA